MADDSKGGSISIPSFLISHSDGVKLIDEIHFEMSKEIEDMINKEMDPNFVPQELDEDDPDYQKVIIKATIELGAKTSSKIYVDLWYANIYELY